MGPLCPSRYMNFFYENFPIFWSMCGGPLFALFGPFLTFFACSWWSQMDRSGNGDCENFLLKALWDPITNFEKIYCLGGSLETHVFKTILETSLFKPKYSMYGMEGFSLQKDLNFLFWKNRALEGTGKMRTEGGGTGGVHQQTGFMEGE